jgi:hypothetical protein
MLLNEIKQLDTLLAPNGHPSRLNQVQYQMVRTPEFKKWFGDWENSPNTSSHVIDENGEPMVVYTGTSIDKDFTKFKTPRNGIWFTKSHEDASKYAMDNDSQKTKYNPDTDRYEQIHTSGRVIPVFINMRKSYILTKEDFDRINVSNYKKAQAILFDELRHHGYDGIQWVGNATWVAIGNANQIKSAIGNIGTFATDSSHIHEGKICY